MASLTQLTWVWIDSGSWWWTGRPGMLRFMRLQRVGHNWATELNWIRSRRHHWMNQSNHFSMKKYLLLNRLPGQHILSPRENWHGESNFDWFIFFRDLGIGTVVVSRVDDLSGWCCWIVYLFVEQKQYGGGKEWGVSEEQICLVNCIVVIKEKSDTSWSQRSRPVMWALETMVTSRFSMCMQLETTGNSPRCVCVCIFCSHWLPCSEWSVGAGCREAWTQRNSQEEGFIVTYGRVWGGLSY